MNDTTKQPIEPIRPTTPEAIALTKNIIRSSRYGALATIDATTGFPLATRVATATDMDGSPIIVASGLAAHTPALLKNPQCSLLLGQIGKGDPLAHARTTLFCRALPIKRDNALYPELKRRFLNRNPKASLYINLPDFLIFKLEIGHANLNGGFGKAFVLTREDLVLEDIKAQDFLQHEQSAIDHMNQDHPDAIALYAQKLCKNSKENGQWLISGIDPDGIDLFNKDSVERVNFDKTLNGSNEIRSALVGLVQMARKPHE